MYQNDIGCENLKICEQQFSYKKSKLISQIKSLLFKAEDIKIIFWIKKDVDDINFIRIFIRKLFGNDQKAKYNFATSSGDLWFLLSNNIKCLDVIHIFGSKEIRVPDSVQKELKEMNAESNLNFHLIKSSIFWKYSKI